MDVSTRLAVHVAYCLSLTGSAEIPINEYYEYFGPTYQLDVLPSNMEDLNTPEYLAKIKTQIFENMRSNTHAPSVQMSAIPKLDHDEMEVDEDLDDPNVRKPRKAAYRPPMKLPNLY